MSKIVSYNFQTKANDGSRVKVTTVNGINDEISISSYEQAELIYSILQSDDDVFYYGNGLFGTGPELPGF